jgi:hypothetical protein
MAAQENWIEHLSEEEIAELERAGEMLEFQVNDGSNGKEQHP